MSGMVTGNKADKNNKEKINVIELRNDELVFSFPDVHEDARCGIDFQRTLRIPDDNQAYPLPPGLGQFPMLHVDDHAKRLPDAWTKHGGVFLPMYQSEALWINFSGSYPCAVKIAAGKINAVTGETWSNDLSADKQDYVAAIPGNPSWFREEWAVECTKDRGRTGA